MAFHIFDAAAFDLGAEEVAGGSPSASLSSVTMMAPSPKTSCARCAPMRRRSLNPKALQSQSTAAATSA
jgi:hypothetical protein